MHKLDRKVAIVGMGYVGLPVAVAFGKKSKTLGFDINTKRLGKLREGCDPNNEVEPSELREADIFFTDQISDLKQADFFIVAVPTPIDDARRPDLSAMYRASESVGQALKVGDIVVYESTVYPGVTEDECVPILERISGLRCGRDFKVGYSPERINPGDKERTFTNIKKVVSGMDPESLEIIAQVYSSVVTAGVFRAKSIQVAEAAKVIENTQRDLNIALMNELAILFDQMGLDTLSVLEAAGTKWNFLKFFPGLVGGHCIGVDPYYLTHKAEKLGYIPQVILAGRRINDSMGKFVAQKTIKKMIHAGHKILDSTVTVLGLTFKENCKDLRNSRVIDIIQELEEFGVRVQIYDPLVTSEEAEEEYGLKITQLNDLQPANAVVCAVAHDAFKELSIQNLKRIMVPKSVLIDVKGIFSGSNSDSDTTFWRL